MFDSVILVLLWLEGLSPCVHLLHYYIIQYYILLLTNDESSADPSLEPVLEPVLGQVTDVIWEQIIFESDSSPIFSKRIATFKTKQKPITAKWQANDYIIDINGIDIALYQTY